MSHTQLTLKERFKIETLLEAGWLQKDIANHIGRNESTVSREISRTEGEKYEALKAQAKSRKTRKITKRKTKKLFVDEEKQDWRKFLRQKKGKYRRRHGTNDRERAREEAKKKRIDTREAVADKRERIGDWEGDTIVGGEKTTGILTHVERKSGFLLADLLKRKTASFVKEKAVERFKDITEDKKHTITYDNGTEFSEHEVIERETDMKIYFAYPYHSWERGTNENTNGLLRQFFPKKSMFAMLTQDIVDKAVDLINNRPRKRLGYLTPYEVFVEGKIAVQVRM